MRSSPSMISPGLAEVVENVVPLQSISEAFVNKQLLLVTTGIV